MAFSVVYMMTVYQSVAVTCKHASTKELQLVSSHKHYYMLGRNYGSVGAALAAETSTLPIAHLMS